MNKELMKGIIDILILSILSQKDSYGYKITKLIKEKTSELYNISDGTLYPALKRLESKNLLTTYWIDTKSNNRRKYYKITDLGKSSLEHNISELHSIIKLITDLKEV